MNANTIQIGADLGVETPRVGRHIPDFGPWLAWIQGRLTAIRLLRQRRRAIGELTRMSDQRLQDLGIPRGQIPEIVDGLIAREGPTVGR